MGNHLGFWMVLVLTAIVVLPLMADLADNPGKRSRSRENMLVVRIRAVEVIWTSVFLCSNDPCKQPPWASISMLFMVLMTEYDTFFLAS